VNRFRQNETQAHFGQEKLWKYRILVLLPFRQCEVHKREGKTRRKRKSSTPDGSAKRLAAMAIRIVAEASAKLPLPAPLVVGVLLRGARAASKQAVRDLPSFNM